MRRIAIAMLFVVLCVGSVYAERERLIWVEELSVPTGQIVSVEPIDTSRYDTMIVQFMEVNHQSFNIMVCVESRIYDDESFRVTTDMSGNRTRFYLSNSSIEEPAKLVCGVYGTETKLDIVNTGSAPVTLKITCALIED
jgi:hypothetical protein